MAVRNCFPLSTSTPPKPNNTSQWIQLYTATRYIYWYATQLSYGIPDVFPIPYPYKAIINQTLLTNDTGAILRIPLVLFNNQSISTSCLNWTATLQNFINPVNNGQRAFVWIICHYFPFSNTPIRNATSSLFPPYPNSRFVGSQSGKLPTSTLQTNNGWNFSDSQTPLCWKPEGYYL